MSNYAREVFFVHPVNLTLIMFSVHGTRELMTDMLILLYGVNFELVRLNLPVF